MNHIKLTLAITLTALAFLCACDDSSSAKDDSQTDVFTNKEKYTYVFTANDKTCGWTTDITDMQFEFGPESSIKITSKDAEGTEVVKGVFREDTDDEGDKYYLIQIKDISGLTFNYYPNEVLFVVTENSITLLSNNKADVEKIKAELCAE